MTENAWGRGEISLYAIVEILVQNRWKLLGWAVAGGAIAGLLAFTKTASYQASASFVPQGSDPTRSGLANIAGQFGVNLTQSNPSLTPDFYRRLLLSRVLLEPISRDTFVVTELGGKRVALLDLLKIPAGSSRLREERGITLLQSVVNVGIEKSTGIVQLTATTPWPSVSLTIASQLLQGVSNYNERMRQTQAAAERRFVESRLALARSDLRAAEDRLSSFQQTNREFGASSRLTFDLQRLQREVALRQEVFTALTQAYEDARIREVRDTPVITVFEPAQVRALPQPRRRLQSVFSGLILGTIFGTLFTFGLIILRRGRPESARTEISVPASSNDFSPDSPAFAAKKA